MMGVSHRVPRDDEPIGRADEAPQSAWAYGTSVAWLRELVDYWRTRFDWRAQEAALNTWPQ